MTENRPPHWLLVGLVPLAAGGLFGLAGPPFAVPWLLLVGWLPIVWVLLRPGFEWKRGLLLGTAVGLGQNLVLAVMLEFPISFAALLIVALTLGWALLGLLLGLLLRRLPAAWALAVIPLTVAFMDFVTVSAVPVFGTAQSLMRPLAPWPALLSISAFAGYTGVVLAVVAAQTGLVVAVTAWRGQRRLVAPAIGVVLLAGIAAALAWGVRSSRVPVRSARVAAVGWTWEDEQPPFTRPGRAVHQVDRLLAPLVREAAAAGATLVVAPEVAFVARNNGRRQMLSRIAALADETDTILVVGYFDRGNNTNHAVIATPDGRIAGEYRKTHLIPGVEDYVAGDGSLLVVETELGPLGVLICQDDNFTDLTREYGRRPISILAVPTNDWVQVQEFHLQNATLRTVDSGFALIRGSSNGVSAVVDGRGRVAGRRDHHARGTGVVVADIPLYRGGSVYAWAGDWLAYACALCVLAFALVAWRRKGS